jgi:hypothetical protein
MESAIVEEVRAHIDALPPPQRDACLQIAEALSAQIDSAGLVVGLLAMALVGAQKTADL